MLFKRRFSSEVFTCFFMATSLVKNSFLTSLSYSNSHMCVLKSGHRVWADLGTELQDFCTRINHTHENAHQLCQPPAHSHLYNDFWTTWIILMPIFMPTAVCLRASHLLGPVDQPKQENCITQKLNLLTDCPFGSVSWEQSSKWHNIFLSCAGQNCA